MRPFPLTRRAWLLNALRTMAAVALAWARPPRAGAGPKAIDYFTGTEWVGKNRSTRFETFYINYWQPMRRIDPGTWSLEVTGLVTTPQRFNLQDVDNLPKQEMTSRMKCVECWSAKATWSGTARPWA